MRRVSIGLWTRNYGDLPFEYVEFRLCRDVYHCLPSELDDEPWGTIQMHLAFIEAERKVHR